jgi:hypothetical protein
MVCRNFDRLRSHCKGWNYLKELELALIHPHMAQKPVLQAEVYARALRASHTVQSTGVWVGARCT